MCAILDEIRGIRARKIDTSPHDPTTRIAWLTQRSIGIMAEERKADAARTKQLEKLSKATVVSWFRQLEQAERAALLREVSRIGQEASVLG